MCLVVRFISIHHIIGDESKRRMAVLYRRLTEVDPAVEEWVTYVERLEQFMYFAASEITGNEKKRAINCRIRGFNDL